MNGFLSRWKDYFEVNAALPDGVPWGAGERLPEEERAWVGPSLAAFQLGESSDGRGLMAAAEACGRERKWFHLAAVTGAFIREEQGHAALLGRFLDREGIPRLDKEWTDIVFRRLRRGMPLRTILTVLVSAEILSLVYYRALSSATSSVTLRALCRKLLADELAHVAYEAALLEGLRRAGSPLRAAVERVAHGLLYGATTGIVYLRHREVLKRGGYPLAAFLAAAAREFRRVMDPAATETPSVPEAGSWEDALETDVRLRWEPVFARSMT
jgi:hypothetical protein